MQVHQRLKAECRTAIGEAREHGKVSPLLTTSRIRACAGIVLVESCLQVRRVANVAMTLPSHVRQDVHIVLLVWILLTLPFALAPFLDLHILHL